MSARISFDAWHNEAVVVAPREVAIDNTKQGLGDGRQYDNTFMALPNV